ncbi:MULTISPECIES: MucR family transcriptional regulator [unclassified Sphingobium]|uniref:MucR family transcriptional regulator n=1 Tax=unclassified Sphingobium TaxID=2611147 RepID=UPI0035A6AD9D
MADNETADVTALTVQLLSAFVSNNTVSSESLADLIKSTRAALTDDVSPPAPPAEPEHVPAVSIRKSLASDEHIISLIDGKPYKTLKRHLASHGLNEKEYRERYGLPASYPMVAPAYSATRRAVAERLGLGRKRTAATSEEAAPVAKTPAKRGRKPAAAADQQAAAAKPTRGRPKVDAAQKSARKKLSIAAPQGEAEKPKRGRRKAAAEPSEAEPGA